MKIGLVVPHIFMQDALLSDVIFSPGVLALSLASGLRASGHDVVLYTPGEVTTDVTNKPSDMSQFNEELAARGYGFTELLKKHPLTFATLARQVQSDVVVRAYEDANKGNLDVVHVYTNEEDIALQFAHFCTVPLVFTHHDPYNLTIGYKRLFPFMKDLQFLALSESQKESMPEDTNWLATIYHGLKVDEYSKGTGLGGYVTYLGRIIESKGVHHAIDAVNNYNDEHPKNPITLKIAGKHYQDSYYQDKIEPRLNENIEIIGFVSTIEAKQDLLGNAQAVLMPSIFDEPFGMVAIESLACGTPVIGLESGALPEIISDSVGKLISKTDEIQIAQSLSNAMQVVDSIDRDKCRAKFESKFTLSRMVKEHTAAYERAIK